MYELGYALPWIAIIGGIIWFVKEASFSAKLHDDISKDLSENKKIREDVSKKH